MFSLFSLQVMEKYIFEGFGISGVFVIGYFGVIFDLVFQKFPVNTYFKVILLF